MEGTSNLSAIRALPKWYSRPIRAARCSKVDIFNSLTDLAYFYAAAMFLAWYCERELLVVAMDEWTIIVHDLRESL